MPADQTLRARWDRTRSVVNLRGDPADAGFVAAVATAMGVALPPSHDTSPASATRRIVPAGPDDWFVLGEPGAQDAIAKGLRAAAGERHHAVTDVSSGYVVLQLSGASVRDVLAQGCPQDLHPRVFPLGRCTGTHFFKASVWLWRTGDDHFELLVRSSFVGYVQSLLEACTAECGMIAA